MMSNGGSGKTKSVFPFEPRLNLRSEAADPLDAAGQTILDVLRQAAGWSALRRDGLTKQA